MANFTRERSDADWYRGLKIPHTVIRNIDEKTKKAISGTGGTYNPAALLTIGGTGLEMQGILYMAFGKAQPIAGKVFRFGDDDYFRHDKVVIREIIESCALIHGGSPGIPRELSNDSTVAMTVPYVITRRNGATLRFPLRLPDGCRLERVTLSFAVGVAHANVPANLPKIRVVRIAADGTITKYPTSDNTIDSNVDADGWKVMARPASGASYFAAGAPQSLVASFNAVTQELTDSRTYGYALEYVDEWGANSFNDMNGGTAIAVQGNLLFTITMKIHTYDLRPY